MAAFVDYHFSKEEEDRCGQWPLEEFARLAGRKGTHRLREGKQPFGVDLRNSLALAPKRRVDPPAGTRVTT